METNESSSDDRALITWVEDKGGRKTANLPVWLLSRMVEMVNERGLFLGVGQLLGGKAKKPRTKKR